MPLLSAGLLVVDILQLVLSKSLALCLFHATGIVAVSTNADTVGITAVAVAVVYTFLCRAADLGFRGRVILPADTVGCFVTSADEGCAAGIITVFRLRPADLDLRQTAAMFAIVDTVVYTAFQACHGKQPLSKLHWLCSHTDNSILCKILACIPAKISSAQGII